MISILNRIMFNKVITEHRGEGMAYTCKSLISLGDRVGYPPWGLAWGVTFDIVHTPPPIIFPKKLLTIF